MLLKNIIYVIIGAGVTACSFALHKTISVKTIPVSNTVQTNNSIDSMVNPYKLQLDKEMNEKISFAEVNFINEKPSGNLGNLIADKMLEQAKSDLYPNMICVLNFGGLRATINQGDVTLGDIFKVLPFDNYLVYVKLKAETVPELKEWLIKNGGQPTAGFYLEKGKLLDANRKDWLETDFWVLTSDYLLNGGDNANFFKKNTEVIQTNILMRDFFISAVKGKSLKDNKEQRIILE